MPEHSARPNPKCAHCGEPATKFRNQTNFCTVCYRLKQMRDDAAVDRKTVPSREALLRMAKELIASGMYCPVCANAMNWLKGDGVATVVTLQHDRSGAWRLICLGCNSRHQHYPGDEFYDLPEGHKRCALCEQVKPLSDFYRHPTYHLGVRSECKACSIAAVDSWRKRNPGRRNHPCPK